jgi:fibronectin-binding autotransporter adhesin
MRGRNESRKRILSKTAHSGLLISAAAAGGLFAGHQASAATYYWNASATPANWDTGAANWSTTVGGSTPADWANANVAYFSDSNFAPPTFTANIDGAVSATGITFNAGNATITASGSGSLTLTGNLTINSGAGNATFDSTLGTVALGTGNQTFTNASSSGGTFAINSNLTNGAAGNSTLTLAGNSTASGAYVVHGNLANAGNGSLTLLANDTAGITLDGNNTYTGLTTLFGGALYLNSDTAINGGGGLTVSASTGILDNTSGSPETLNNVGTFATVNGRVTAFGGSNNLTINSPVTTPGTMAFTMNGTANLTLGQFQNIRSGNTVTLDAVSGGTNSGTLTFSSMLLNLGNTTVGGYSDTIFGNGTVAITGAITDTTGNTSSPLGLTYGNASVAGGGGTLILSGASTYTGNTTINLGTVILTGSLASSNVKVGTPGASVLTPTLTGNGSLTGNLTVTGPTQDTGNVTGVLAQYNSSQFTLGNLTLDGGSNVDFNSLSTTIPTFVADGTLKLATTGKTTLNGIPTNLAAGVYELFDYSSLTTIAPSPTTSLASVFTGFTAGAGETYTISSTSGNNSGSGLVDLTVTVVPEPGSLGLLALGAMGGLLGMRRRGRPNQPATA